MKDAIQPCIFRHPSHGSPFTLPRETDLRPRPIGAILNFLFKLTYGVKLHIDTRKFHDIELVRSINCLLDDLINIEIEVQVFGLCQVVKLIMIASRAKIAPFVDHNHTVSILNGDRTVEWPCLNFVKLKGGL